MRRSPLTLAALATAAVPGLDVVATRAPQHDGTDFAVTGILDAGGRRWVVRCPQHQAAGAALEGEVALLERLAEASDSRRIPFDVPRPAGFAPLPEGGRAMVYRELIGRPLDLAQLTPGPFLAAQLGRTLAAIHELPTDVIDQAGLPVYDADSWRRRRLAELDEAARTGDVPTVLLDRWERALEDVRLWRFTATVVHGDLAPEHVLVSAGDVAAVIDWSHAQVGDPADDLAWLFAAAPEDSLDAVLEAYSLARTERGDTHLAARATLASELALARWLLHGVRTDERSIVREATRMLRDLADLVRDAPGIGAEEPVVVSEPVVIPEPVVIREPVVIPESVTVPEPVAGAAAPERGGPSPVPGDGEQAAPEPAADPDLTQEIPVEDRPRP